MKKLGLLFLSAFLIAACNNSNPFAKKENDSKLVEKEDDKEPAGKEKKKGAIEGFTKGLESNGSNWTKADRDRWMNKCEEVMTDNGRLSKQVCACILDKVERKYPNATDAEEATAEEGRMMMQECAGAEKNVDEYAGEDRNTGDNSNNGETTTGGSWTRMQREQYIQGCETTARRALQGYTAQQAHAYCECMTLKVERKYNFQQAAKMTAADFQTREWQNAATDCLPQN